MSDLNQRVRVSAVCKDAEPVAGSPNSRGAVSRRAQTPVIVAVILILVVLVSGYSLLSRRTGVKAGRALEVIDEDADTEDLEADQLDANPSVRGAPMPEYRRPNPPPSILNTLFDHIYLVNMPSRKDRLALSLFKLEQHGVTAEVFPAVIGSLPKYDALAATMRKIPKTFITTRGALGLMLTWQAMVADALAKKYKYVLILEDDINFAYNFDKVMAAAAPLIESKQGIDVAYLGANQYRFDDTQKAAMASGKGFYELSPRNWHFTYGTYAMALSRRALLAVHERIKKLEVVTDPADVMVWRVATTNKLRTRVLYPFPILPDVIDSDNGGGREQDTYCDTRRCNPAHYNFLSMTQTNRLRELLGAEGLSLRRLFAKAGPSLTRRALAEQAALVMQPEAAALVQAVAVYLTPRGNDASPVDIGSMIRLVEGPAWVEPGVGGGAEDIEDSVDAGGGQDAAVE